MTVGELTQKMTHQELLEWQAYYSLEPFTQDRTEIQLATLNFLISTTNGGKADYKDFFISKPPPSPSPSKPTKIKGLAQAIGGL